MKVGNIINGLTVADVKRVNKLNLIQFLKEVDSYLQKGYQIDVTSGRQVGLVLQADVYKTEAASSVKVESTGVDSNDVGSTGEQIPTESVGVSSKEAEGVPETVVTESTAQQEQVNDESVEAPVAPKKTTTRNKKTAQ